MSSSNDLELLLLTLVIFAGSISTVGFPMEVGHLDLDHDDHEYDLDRLMVFGRGFFDGSLSVDPADLHRASVDFGGGQATPAKLMAVLRPGSVNDVVKVVKAAYESRRGFPVSARGHGHSTNGQARPYSSAPGIVIEMSNYNNKNVMTTMMKQPNVVIDGGDHRGSYVDVWGGELWIEVLKASLEHGLAPKSWTDYLYLSVGGTLSNGGISGQAFNHGPQIANVHELDVVTGKGELLTCSEEQNTDLFHGVLGGLGQFGIITRARIALEPAPQRVRWVRVLYSNFHDFTKDQEYLISLHGKPNSERFDYVEGFVIVDEGLINNWRSSFFSSPRNPIKFTSFGVNNGGVIYSLEITRNYDESTSHAVDQEVEALLKKLNYIPSSVFTTDLPYMDFLDRVHKAELKLRSKGLWEVPHPWLNLFVPKSRIADFDIGVFKGILGNKTSGPILIYPMNKNKWDHRDSVVTPDEEVFYLVALLKSALDSGDETQSLEYLSNQNRRILSFCDEAGIQVKQYLPHHSTEEEWKGHFGEINWERFVKRKVEYDPRRILATGQRIFAPQFDSRASSSL